MRFCSKNLFDSIDSQEQPVSQGLKELRWTCWTRLSFGTGRESSWQPLTRQACSSSVSDETGLIIFLNQARGTVWGNFKNRHLDVQDLNWNPYMVNPWRRDTVSWRHVFPKAEATSICLKISSIIVIGISQFIFGGLAVQQDPAFKKPLFKNESSYTMRPFMC